MIDNYPEQYMGNSEPNKGQFAVCQGNLSLVAVGESFAGKKRYFNKAIGFCELEIWNYDDYSCLFHYEFENIILPINN